MDKRPIWLVNNASSGSNDDEALAALERCCDEHGFRVAHRTTFPAQDLPTPAMLDAAGLGQIAVFAGDGTINALLEGLGGWGGAVLVLPGGTMNLLFHRLHADRTIGEVIAAAARGEAQRCRPDVVRSAHGTAYAGLLAGPGTSWNRVREAMREGSIAAMAGETVAAIEETVAGETIACVDPALGRPEGYPLLMLTPRADGIDVSAYYAETAGDYLDQAWALVRRNFREGPHDSLGRARRLRLASTEGAPFGLLIDGEPADADASAEFSLAACGVDLLATERDDF